MDGDVVGILRAGERENTDQAEKDRGNVIHQTSCGWKGPREEGGEDTESRTAVSNDHQKDTDTSDDLKGRETMSETETMPTALSRGSPQVEVKVHHVARHSIFSVSKRSIRG